VLTRCGFGRLERTIDLEDGVADVSETSLGVPGKTPDKKSPHRGRRRRGKR
jgi:hypothetical protein